jgi:hypothetical protein
VVKSVEEMDFNFGTSVETPRHKKAHSNKESPLKGEDLALQPADVEIKLDRVFAESPPNSKERAQFENLFLDDMARALGVPRHLLQVRNFLPKYDISRQSMLIARAC